MLVTLKLPFVTQGSLQNKQLFFFFLQAFRWESFEEFPISGTDRIVMNFRLLTVFQDLIMAQIFGLLAKYVWCFYVTSADQTNWFHYPKHVNTGFPSKRGVGTPPWQPSVIAVCHLQGTGSACGHHITSISPVATVQRTLCLSPRTGWKGSRERWM